MFVVQEKDMFNSRSLLVVQVELAPVVTILRLLGVWNGKDTKLVNIELEPDIIYYLEPIRILKKKTLLKVNTPGVIPLMLQ